MLGLSELALAREVFLGAAPCLLVQGALRRPAGRAGEPSRGAVSVGELKSTHTTHTHQMPSVNRLMIHPRAAKAKYTMHKPDTMLNQPARGGGRRGAGSATAAEAGGVPGGDCVLQPAAGGRAALGAYSHSLLPRAAGGLLTAFVQLLEELVEDVRQIGVDETQPRVVVEADEAAYEFDGLGDRVGEEREVMRERQIIPGNGGHATVRRQGGRAIERRERPGVGACNVT